MPVVYEAERIGGCQPGAALALAHLSRPGRGYGYRYGVWDDLLGCVLSPVARVYGVMEAPWRRHGGARGSQEAKSEEEARAAQR